MINKLIIESLRPLNIPVTFQKYTGMASEYITFHCYFTQGEAFDDDSESLTGQYIQIDVWTKSDYTKIVNNTRNLLINMGFKRINEFDLYENDTKIFHKVMKFFYMEGELCQDK
jgi:hypothetical protein